MFRYDCMLYFVVYTHEEMQCGAVGVLRVSAVGIRALDFDRNGIETPAVEKQKSDPAILISDVIPSI